uniref:Immunoglobulin-like domain containing receptor 1b n=1 Tax=Oryzias latipes TaxID=8090 RepID=A0A3P9M2L4_ORYLA
MENLFVVLLLLVHLPTELLSVQVVVPQTERSTMLFSNVILYCDYSTSASSQDVLVSWKFKSFCKDPVLEYYSTAYQAALQLGQDPANDCPDRQRTVRTVVQKRGGNEPILGVEYRNRKITIQNKADLVINEVMWWDNGMYYCSIDAAGDTTGDSDREIKLIVFHWLTVLLIILGALLLIMLCCICCCQCCPQKCCCYVRCPCCPQTCCCPEKAVMQHRMVREAQKAMAPWMKGQPIYAPISSNMSSQGGPLLYPGLYSDYPTKQSFAMTPMQPSPMALQQQAPPPPPHQYSGSFQGSIQGTNQVLDFLENQVKGLDVGVPQMSPYAHQIMLQPQPRLEPAPHAVPYAPGPPSMLSALDEMGVKGVERRVITLPPIVQRIPSMSSHGGAAGRHGARGYRASSHSSGSTNPSARGYADNAPARHGILRDYSDDSDLDFRRGRAPHRGSRNEGGGSSGRSRGGSRPRTRSQDDLLEEMYERAARKGRSLTPPQRHKEPWSSDEEDRRRRKGGRGKGWTEQPPSYSTIDIQHGNSSSHKNYAPLSDRGSHSSSSVVI